MELKSLPIIDWDLCVKVAGNKKELAEEILSLLIANLSDDMIIINNFHLEQDYAALLRKIHNLHGALCYSGLPRLKMIVSNLETALKNNIMSSLLSLLDQLHAEVNLLLEHYSLHASRSREENA